MSGYSIAIPSLGPCGFSASAAARACSALLAAALPAPHWLWPALRVAGAGGIAAVWMQEANEGHVVEGNWIQDFGGFGLYANGVGVGDMRCVGQPKQ